MGVVLGSSNVCSIWRCNNGIFYHCFFLAFWSVSGGRVCFHSFPFCRVSSDRWQAFFSFLVSCYAILIEQPLGICSRAFLLCSFQPCSGPTRAFYALPYIPPLPPVFSSCAPFYGLIMAINSKAISRPCETLLDVPVYTYTTSSKNAIRGIVQGCRRTLY